MFTLSNQETDFVKIEMTSGEKKKFTPSVITNDEIDRFLNWIERRQHGEGAIFYNIKTTDGMTFINYYMITSVNVYNESAQ